MIMDEDWNIDQLENWRIGLASSLQPQPSSNLDGAGQRFKRGLFTSFKLLQCKADYASQFISPVFDNQKLF